MAHSEELRLKVIRARTKLSMSIRRTAEVFGIGEETVKRWMREYKHSGKTKPIKGNRGAKRILQGESELLFLKLVQDYPEATLVEFSNLLWEHGEIEISPSSLSRALKRLGITRKKNSSGKGISN